ncbi:Uncharacterised protein [Legionella quateirensis]|uniref:Uncharacterized protein n=1 Tax=Legionella quateirensis TaxID=45072 RepID=A0A378KVJ6_9GAMM|nr:Uncharacterised protein [Legionella quateirensis]
MTQRFQLRELRHPERSEGSPTIGSVPIAGDPSFHSG